MSSRCKMAKRGMICAGVVPGPSLQPTDHIFVMSQLRNSEKRPEIFAHERSYPFLHVLNIVKGSVLTFPKLTTFFLLPKLKP